MNSAYNLRSRERPTSRTPTEQKQTKKERPVPTRLDQIVLASIVQKLPSSVSKLMGFELVSQSFARALRSAAYSKYCSLKIECNAAEDDDDEDDDDEDKDDSVGDHDGDGDHDHDHDHDDEDDEDDDYEDEDDGDHDDDDDDYDESVGDCEEKNGSTVSEDVFCISIGKEVDVWLATYAPKDPIKCLAVIFARFSNISSLITNSYHQWEINEMILRAVIIAKCELIKIKSIFMDIPYIVKDLRVEKVLILTPALFADSLRRLQIEDLSSDTFRYTLDYFGKYLKSINLRYLSLLKLNLPLSGFGLSDCLPKYFGHMSNLRYLMLEMPHDRGGFAYPVLAYPGTVEFLSKLRSFTLKMFAPVGSEDDPQFDAYISLCKKLPDSVRLWLNWTNELNYKKPKESAGHVSCALRISSQTRATVTMAEECGFGGEKSFQMLCKFVECLSKTMRKKGPAALSVSSYLKKPENLMLLNFRITLKGNTISFSV